MDLFDFVLVHSLYSTAEALFEAICSTAILSVVVLYSTPIEHPLSFQLKIISVLVERQICFLKHCPTTYLVHFYLHLWSNFKYFVDHSKLVSALDFPYHMYVF